MSAALLLGRARRRVLLCDVGRPRNYLAQGVRGFLSRAGIRPDELRRIAREELRHYGVDIRETLVTDARSSDGAKAAVTVDRELQDEDCRQAMRESSPPQ